MLAGAGAGQKRTGSETLVISGFYQISCASLLNTARLYQDCGSGLIRSFLVGSWPVSQLLGRWQKNHAAGFAGCIFLLSRLGLCSRIAGTMSFNLDLDSVFFMHPDRKFSLKNQKFNACSMRVLLGYTNRLGNLLCQIPVEYGTGTHRYFYFILF